PARHELQRKEDHEQGEMKDRVGHGVDQLAEVRDLVLAASDDAVKKVAYFTDNKENQHEYPKWGAGQEKQQQEWRKSYPEQGQAVREANRNSPLRPTLLAR